MKISNLLRFVHYADCRCGDIEGVVDYLILLGKEVRLALTGADALKDAETVYRHNRKRLSFELRTLCYVASRSWPQASEQEQEKDVNA